MRNILNKERGEPPKRTPSLDELSLITTHLEIESAYAQCNITNERYSFHIVESTLCY
jgi:hypothetical protein